MTAKDAVALRNHYAEFLARKVPDGVEAVIKITIDDEERLIKTKHATATLKALFLQLTKGRGDRKIVDWILTKMKKPALTMIEIRQLMIEIESQ